MLLSPLHSSMLFNESGAISDANLDFGINSGIDPENSNLDGVFESSQLNLVLLCSCKCFLNSALLCFPNFSLNGSTSISLQCMYKY